MIVWDYTRLSRNLTVLNQLIEQCRTYGAQVVTLTGVEVAERFMVSGGLLDDARESPDRSTPGLFPLPLIQAAFSGLSPRESLVVAAILPSGETVSGVVVGIGSRIGIQTTDGTLLEDIRAEWIVRCYAQENE